MTASSCSGGPNHEAICIDPVHGNCQNTECQLGLARNVPERGSRASTLNTPLLEILVTFVHELIGGFKLLLIVKRCS
jgi:hypothetical protein